MAMKGYRRGWAIEDHGLVPWTRCVWVEREGRHLWVEYDHEGLPYVEHRPGETWPNPAIYFDLTTAREALLQYLDLQIRLVVGRREELRTLLAQIHA